MASLVVKIFSLFVTFAGISSGAEIPFEIPAGCTWVDNTCQPDTQDTIIHKSNVGKALCCPKGLYKDEEDKGLKRSSLPSGCRWIGNAPFCMADKCHSNEHVAQTSKGGDGHDCLTGQKYLCCPNKKAFSLGAPYSKNGNDDEKLSKNVDVKYFNKLNRNLGEKWDKGGQKISFTGTVLTLKDEKTFIPNIETVIMSHGFLAKASGHHGCETFVKTYKDAGRDVQVICIDWRNLANLAFHDPLAIVHFGGPYNGEAQNSIDVGWWMGRLLNSLVKKTGLDPNKIHLIGHSLGAHVVGTMGRTFTALSGKQVARITGLDPAGPLFVRDAYDLKGHMIKKEDGAFVDIIHTNGALDPYAFNILDIKDSAFMGDLHSLGHVDFYPNGGKRQTASGCLPTIGYCSHGRSIDYYLDTISAGSAGFSAYPCADASSCSKGEKTSKAVGNHMGEFATKPNEGDQKQYYLDVTKDYGFL